MFLPLVLYLSFKCQREASHRCPKGELVVSEPEYEPLYRRHLRLPVDLQEALALGFCVLVISHCLNTAPC